MTVRDPGWLGVDIAEDKITNSAAKRFLKTLKHRRIEGFRLLRITSNADLWQILVIEVTVDRPQQVVHEILYRETIALGFIPGGQEPVVLPVRPDFPNVMHLNLTPRPYPNSLCLYDQPLAERQLQQTPLKFLERIRWWLAQTAIDALHGADQPLEPVFQTDVTTLVVEREFIKTVQEDFGFASLGAFDGTGNRVILADRGNPKRPSGAPGANVITVLAAPPSVHGRIRSAPLNLEELAAALTETGVDIITVLKERILRFNDKHPDQVERMVIVVVCFPIKRDARSDIETVSYRAFHIHKRIGELGVALGILAANGGAAKGPKFVRLVQKGPVADLDEIQVWTMQTAWALDRAMAAQLSGTKASDRRIVLVGAGTLGSLLAQTLVRAGNGLWTIIDPDVLLPHNIARHSTTHHAVGGSKALAVAALLNDILVGETGDVATPIHADVVNPGKDAEAVEKAIMLATVVLDASASVTVARHLAMELKGASRNISVFFTPSGLDLVILCETRAPSVSLLTLEAQYYRAVISNDALDSHLAAPPGQLYPVGSCRHPSSVLSYAKAAALVGLGTSLLDVQMASEAPAITVLQMDATTGAVQHRAIEVAEPLLRTFDDWTICWDLGVEAELMNLRTSALPAETGGVLVGFYDLPRKLVYVVKALSAPPDSTETTTSFERGVTRVPDLLADIGRRTLGQVGYIGEWHSHPDGVAARPSTMDVTQLVWLVDKLSIVEQPAVMIIVGEDGPTITVGFMKDE
ncbi:MAG: Mov34/MPN/PAD-1 family protein [Rhodospirillaceae bacterium]|nr:Mov34/MPN/PAD-1 family protein [Rhodospirillaceae bacterium]